jgi:hypothetical protein
VGVPPPPPEDPTLPPPRLDLPPPPHIVKPSTPTAYPDGTLSVYGLRLSPDTYFKKEVRVQGLVDDVYECPWAELQEKEFDARERARKFKQPIPPFSNPMCKEPYFFMTDEAGARQKLLVVGYDPTDKKTKVPKKGDKIIVAGVVDKDSADGFISPQGLLIIKSWEPFGVEAKEQP